MSFSYTCSLEDHGKCIWCDCSCHLETEIKNNRGRRIGVSMTFKNKKTGELVEAMKLRPATITRCEEFVGGDAGNVGIGGGLVFATADGPMHATVNDWIVRSKRGGFESFPPNEFVSDFVEVAR